jgi:hypothetical protein
MSYVAAYLIFVYAFFQCREVCGLASQLHKCCILRCDTTSHIICCVLTARILKVYTQFMLY